MDSRLSAREKGIADSSSDEEVTTTVRQRDARQTPRSDPVAVSSPRRVSPRSPARSPVGSPRGNGSPRSSAAAPALQLVPVADSDNEDERDPLPRRSGAADGGKKSTPAAVVVVPNPRQLVMERRRRSQQPIADVVVVDASASSPRRTNQSRKSGDELPEGSPRAQSPRVSVVARFRKNDDDDGLARLSDCPLDDIFITPGTRNVLDSEDADADDEDIENFFRKK
jgi:hypothetical protein